MTDPNLLKQTFIKGGAKTLGKSAENFRRGEKYVISGKMRTSPQNMALFFSFQTSTSMKY